MVFVRTVVLLVISLGAKPWSAKFALKLPFSSITPKADRRVNCS